MCGAQHLRMQRRLFREWRHMSARYVPFSFAHVALQGMLQIVNAICGACVCGVLTQDSRQRPPPAAACQGIVCPSDKECVAGACQCRQGFAAGANGTCIAVCTAPGPCDANATCVGPNQCQCNTGFTGTGYICTPGMAARIGPGARMYS
jgi:hypothetical protein